MNKVTKNNIFVVIGIVLLVLILGRTELLSIVSTNIFSTQWQPNISNSYEYNPYGYSTSTCTELNGYQRAQGTCEIGMAIPIDLLNEFDNNNLQKITITNARATYHTGYNSTSLAKLSLFKGSNWSDEVYSISSNATTYHAGVTWITPIDPSSDNKTDTIIIDKNGVYVNGLKTNDLTKILVGNTSHWFFNQTEITKLYVGHYIMVNANSGNGGIDSPMYSSGTASSNVTYKLEYTTASITPPPVTLPSWNFNSWFQGIVDSIINWLQGLFK